MNKALIEGKAFLLNNKVFSLFMLSIFLIKIPPFYIGPENILFSSHSLVKVIIIVISTATISINYKQIQRLFSKNKLIFLLILLYLTSQTLSLLGAFDIFLFLKTYHNTLVAILIFFLAYSFIKVRPKLLTVINYFVIFTAILTVLFESFFSLFSQSFLSFLGLFIQQEVLAAYTTNISRGRATLDMNIELFLPFLIFYLFNNKINKKTKVFLLITLIILTLLSIVSNFRSRLLVLFFSLIIFVFVILIKKRKELFKKKSILFLGLLSSFVLILYLALNISNKLYSFNIVDRLLLQNKYEDVETLSFRIESIGKSIDLFNSSPIVGIGLGNYAIYNPAPYNNNLLLSNNEKTYKNLVFTNPHNIFAQLLSESGLLGFTTFLCLMIFFIISDFKYVKSARINVIFSYIIGSWSIFVFWLFNPATTIYIIGWYWFFRGIIEGSKNYNRIE